jgi:hypothetical protein
VCIDLSFCWLQKNAEASKQSTEETAASVRAACKDLAGTISDVLKKLGDDGVLLARAAAQLRTTDKLLSYNGTRATCLADYPV